MSSVTIRNHINTYCKEIMSFPKYSIPWSHHDILWAYDWYLYTDQSNVSAKKHIPSISNKSDLFCESVLSEIARRSYYKYSTPNSTLLQSNILFENLEKHWWFWVLHVTKNRDQIIKSGKMYVSTGCLPYTIYWVPALPWWDVHNLIEYMLSKEIASQNNEQWLLYIHFNALHQQTNIYNNWFDSRACWNEYYTIIQKLSKSNISEVKEQTQELIHQATIHRTDISSELNILSELYYTKSNKYNRIIDTYTSLCQKNNFFTWVSLEVLIEYIMLYQDDTRSQYLKQNNEVNNEHYKNIIFSLAPSMKWNFNISHFIFDPKQRSDKIIENHCISQFDYEHFIRFISTRILHNLTYKILWSELPDDSESLIWNIIYHTAKRNEHYAAFQSAFNTERKDFIHTTRKKYNTVFPYNSVIPKWEIWINPHILDWSYDVYTCYKDQGKLVLWNKVDIVLTDSLIADNLRSMTARH